MPQLVNTYFKNTPGGIPGNDDTGTMSAWAIFSMMGFYPDCPGVPEYTLTTPMFDKVVIKLDPRYYQEKELVITAHKSGQTDETNRIGEVKLGGQKHKGVRVTHNELVHAGTLDFYLK